MSETFSRNSQPEQDEYGIELADSSGKLRRWVIVRHTTVWQPPTDVYELDERLIVMVEIAGMRDSDFNVMLQSQLLTISGTRQRQSHPNCAYHQLEIRFGEFRTEVSLPWPVRRDEVSATYRDGFLRVELPRMEASPRPVKVVNLNAGSESESSDRDER